jgi:O-antigen ligase
LLVNLILFVRPADLFQDLAGIEFYQYLIIACFLVSFPAVLGRLSPDKLEKSPIDVFVLFWLPFIVLSHLGNSRALDAWHEGFTYFKVIVYFLLLVSLVTTPRRMELFTSCLIVFTCVTTILSVLDFHKVIQLPRYLSETGLPVLIDPNRMYGPGIFQDPNDICIIIVSSLMLLLGKLTNKHAGPARLLWLVPLGVFAYGFYLTQSRGGLLALVAGAGILIVLRYGWLRAMMLGALGLPLLLVMLGTRQTAISSTTNTGQERIQLWNEGMVMFRANPVFGVGMNRYHEQAGHVAHNSFMQAFADTGFMGGLIFLGMATLAVWGLYRHVRTVRVGSKTLLCTIVDPNYRQIHPFLTGAMTAYASGMMTLSLNNLVTTYTFLGLASVFLAQATCQPATPPRKFDLGLVLRFAGLSVLFLGAMFVFIRLTFRP